MMGKLLAFEELMAQSLIDITAVSRKWMGDDMDKTENGNE